MTDAEYQAQKARVQAMLDKWVNTTGLGWWRMTYVWVRDPAVAGENGASSKDTGAVCSVSWQYLCATITFYLPTLADEDDDHLEWIIVHELMHVFLREMRWTNDDGDNIDHEERVATMLAHGFLWTRIAGWNEAKDSLEPDVYEQMARSVAA